MAESAPRGRWRLIPRRIGGEGLMRSAAALIGGTLAAQVITIVALPVLTRFYDPDDFKILAAFLSLHNVLAVIACLRFEIAIPVARNEDDAQRLSLLAALSAVAMAIALGLVWLLFGPGVATRLGVEQLGSYLWLLPFSVMFAGIYGATQYWATRRREYRRIATTRVTQAVSGTGVQLGLGAAGVAPLGLLLGQAVLAGFGVVGLGRSWIRDGVLGRLREGWRPLAATFRDYRRFPQYSTIEAFANRGGGEIPMLLIAAFAARPEAGYLLLAIKVLGAPLSLVGNALTQVFLGDARAHHEKQQLDRLTEKIVVLLAKVGTGPIIFVSIVAPTVFAVVFGDRWVRAGEIVGWMTGWSLFKFLTSPISGVLHVQMRQRAMSVLQLTGLVMQVGTTLLAAFFLPGRITEAFAMASAAFYALCLVVYCRAAGADWLRMARSLPAIGAIVAGWIVLGVAVAWAAARLV